MSKRRMSADVSEEDTPVAKKTRRKSQDEEREGEDLPDPETPTGRKSILRSPTKLNGFNSIPATPSSLRKVLFSTPAKSGEEAQDEDEDEGEGEATPTAAQNDRSARRRSQRALEILANGDDDSDEGDTEQNEAIAKAILGEDDELGIEDDGIDTSIVVSGVSEGTPSRSGKPRGRPKGRRKERTPSPPPNLPPHELYFFQNRAGGNKTSTETIPTGLLLDHDDYNTAMSAYHDPHAADLERLKRLHHRAFDQWLFELQEGFNLCLYGYGSKRDVIMEFAEHLYQKAEESPTIIVANAYTPGFTIRDILTRLAAVALPKHDKLPAQPAPMLDTLFELLPQSATAAKYYIIIHSMDHINLRKGAAQAFLARLASHPNISLIASCDTPLFPLLWDVTLSKQLRFLHHDTTTFNPYKAEIEVIEDVNALLGRSGRRLGGKDGVGYVLKSLPENARSLFRILVAEQLALLDSEGDIAIDGFGDDSEPEDIIGMEDEEEAAMEQQTPSRRGRGRPPKTKKKAARPMAVARPSSNVGVEYRTLYHKAVEEFVCSSEVNFRTLLKEFHDHQMIESRKDALGTERLVIPFRREELETILEELV